MPGYSPWTSRHPGSRPRLDRPPPASVPGPPPAPLLPPQLLPSLGPGCPRTGASPPPFPGRRTGDKSFKSGKSGHHIRAPTSAPHSAPALRAASTQPPVQLGPGRGMEKDFQDIQQLDPEESDHQLGRGEGPGAQGHSPGGADAFWKGAPPPQSPLRRLGASLWLSLLVLGFNALLLVAVCVMASQRAQIQREFWTLKDAFSNFSASTLTEIRTLSFHGGSTGDKVTSLEAKLEKQQLELRADHATLLFHLKHFPADVRVLSCQMAFLRSNGTECCPVGWLEHAGSCYWFSRSGLSWPEAEKYCRLENAHLVAINSREEQKFIAQHSSPFYTWIGLTESDGSWKWVDGTDYENGYKNWAFGEPNDWQGHEEGGSEDCAAVREDGRWNDDFCLQLHRWACEAARNATR